MVDDDGPPHVDRRSLLKSAVAGVTAGSMQSSMASASDGDGCTQPIADVDPASERYSTVGTTSEEVEWVIHDHHYSANEIDYEQDDAVTHASLAVAAVYRGTGSTINGCLPFWDIWVIWSGYMYNEDEDSVFDPGTRRLCVDIEPGDTVDALVGVERRKAQFWRMADADAIPADHDDVDALRDHYDEEGIDAEDTQDLPDNIQDAEAAAISGLGLMAATAVAEVASGPVPATAIGAATLGWNYVVGTDVPNRELCTFGIDKDDLPDLGSDVAVLRYPMLPIDLGDRPAGRRRSFEVTASLEIDGFNVPEQPTIEETIEVSFREDQPWLLHPTLIPGRPEDGRCTIRNDYDVTAASNSVRLGSDPFDDSHAVPPGDDGDTVDEFAEADSLSEIEESLPRHLRRQLTPSLWVTEDEFPLQVYWTPDSDGIVSPTLYDEPPTRTITLEDLGFLVSDTGDILIDTTDPAHNGLYEATLPMYGSRRVLPTGRYDAVTLPSVEELPSDVPIESGILPVGTDESAITEVEWL